MKFSVEYLIRFQHCDPAGIVFYPRYYEMLNQVVEDWFAQELDWSFSRLANEFHEGIPLAHAHCDFLTASQIGDLVTFDLSLQKLSRKSFTVAIEGHCNGQVRIRATLVLVYAGLEPGLHSLPIPEQLRRNMQRFIETDPAGA